jgi:hypothetical protein
MAVGPFREDALVSPVLSDEAGWRRTEPFPPARNATEHGGEVAGDRTPRHLYGPPSPAAFASVRRRGPGHPGRTGGNCSKMVGNSASTMEVRG